MAELKTVLAKNMTYLRTNAGMTQAELAARLNYSDKSVSKWEWGEGLPDVAVLVQLAEIYNVPLDWLVTEHTKQRPPTMKNGMTRNQRLVSVIALVGVLTLALTVFISFWVTGQVVWQVFIAALPVMCVVYLVLNSVWGRPRDNLYVISVLVWTLLLFFYVLFLERNLWLLFVLGVPAQAAVSLSFRIRLSKQIR